MIQPRRRPTTMITSRSSWRARSPKTPDSLVITGTVLYFFTYQTLLSPLRCGIINLFPIIAGYTRLASGNRDLPRATIWPGGAQERAPRNPAFKNQNRLVPMASTGRDPLMSPSEFHAGRLKHFYPHTQHYRRSEKEHSPNLCCTIPTTV